MVFFYQIRQSDNDEKSRYFGSKKGFYGNFIVLLFSSLLVLLKVTSKIQFLLTMKLVIVALLIVLLSYVVANERPLGGLRQETYRSDSEEITYYDDGSISLELVEKMMASRKEPNSDDFDPKIREFNVVSNDNILRANSFRESHVPQH